MKRTEKLTVCGVMGALSLVCLLLTVFPFATYALPALASVFFMPVVIECGKRWALALYVAVSLLALLVVPDLEARLLFVFFFGYYPVFKSWAEGRPRPVEWACKLGVFNIAVVAAYALLSAVGFSLSVFMIPGLAVSLAVMLLLFLLAGNLIFIMYDIGLSRMLPLYFSRLQPLWRRLFK